MEKWTRSPTATCWSSNWAFDSSGLLCHARTSRKRISSAFRGRVVLCVGKRDSTPVPSSSLSQVQSSEPKATSRLVGGPRQTGPCLPDTGLLCPSLPSPPKQQSRLHHKKPESHLHQANKHPTPDFFGERKSLVFFLFFSSFMQVPLVSVMV